MRDSSIVVGPSAVDPPLKELLHRLDRLQKVFAGASERLMYLIDREGNLLAHPTDQLVFEAKQMNDIPIVEKALESQLKSGQVRFELPGTDEVTGQSSMRHRRECQSKIP